MSDLYDEWPKTADGRLICTSAKPLPLEFQSGYRAMHPEAKDDGRNDPYYNHYICPACGMRFSTEVAE